MLELTGSVSINHSDALRLVSQMTALGPLLQKPEGGPASGTGIKSQREGMS